MTSCEEKHTVTHYNVFTYVYFTFYLLDITFLFKFAQIRLFVCVLFCDRQPNNKSKKIHFSKLCARTGMIIRLQKDNDSWTASQEQLFKTSLQRKIYSSLSIIFQFSIVSEFKKYVKLQGLTRVLSWDSFT